MKNNQKELSNNDLVMITGGFCNICVCYNNSKDAIKPATIGSRDHYQQCKADCLECGVGFNDFKCFDNFNIYQDIFFKTREFKK